MAAATSLDQIPPPAAVETAGRPASAVLVPLYEGPSGPELIATRRAWHLRSHRGEVSFPGGRFEPGDDSLIHTALRESHEEVALEPDIVEVVGKLDGLVTVSSPAPIVPILGVLDRRPDLVANPDEVDGILHLRVAELWEPANFRSEIWARNGDEMDITFFELVGDTLWGATGRILRDWFEQAARKASQR